MFTLGDISTLLMALAVISVKNLAIGVMLLIVAVSQVSNVIYYTLKRLFFIFLPVMFTLGVISTLLMALVVISVKKLAIGVMLLIVTVSQAVSRLFLAAAPPPAPFVFHPRAELLPAPLAAAPWPAPGPVLSPWARSDNDGTTISD
ncbi:hypothetical protein NE865_04599 [Phthorimaea operculella]|nr:hypothetical protein NE865_04599 [Phthorimaea operculella]